MGMPKDFLIFKAQFKRRCKDRRLSSRSSQPNNRSDKRKLRSSATLRSSKRRKKKSWKSSSKNKIPLLKRQKMEMNKPLSKKNPSLKQLNCFLNNKNRHQRNTKMMIPSTMKSKPRKNARDRRKTAAKSQQEHHGMYQSESFSV